MRFLRMNYLTVSLSWALLAGILVFFISYQTSRNDLIEQTTRTIRVSTDVKWKLLERKLYSLEQQLNLLSQKDKVAELLSSPGAQPKADARFDEYISALLNNQGVNNITLISPSGEVAYTRAGNLTQASIPQEVYRRGGEGSDLDSKIVLAESEPYPFYFCKGVVDSRKVFLGTVFMEVPKEFLSIELHNTISMDSLSSYLFFSRGFVDQLGRMQADTCVSCTWSEDEFIQFSPNKKIKNTWTLLSVYPISQIAINPILYGAGLDGLIGFLVASIVALLVTYTLQAVQKSKGITHSDILLVQTTWNAVSEYSIKIIAGFYKHLFTDAPQLKPLFKSEQSVQEKRMALMLNTIVNSADSLEEFKGSIAQLAKRHTHMGVKNEYFPLVVKAIVSSVEDQYGSGFSSAHKKAWYKILNRISAIMIEEMDAYKRSLPGTAA